MIKIFDNFLDAKEYEEINHFILSDYFPWSCKDGKVNAMDNLVGMTHTFYLDNNILSNYYKHLFPIILKCNMQAIRRIKANLDLKSLNIKTMLHTDYTTYLKEQWTGIYYVNSNNGKTFFENGDEIESVANRMIVFPANTPHGTITQTDTNRRILINFNWYGGNTSKDI